MDFKTATDRIAVFVTHADIARATTGVSLHSIRQARLEPSSRGYRKPWREALAKLARERGGELVGLADELESGR